MYLEKFGYFLRALVETERVDYLSECLPMIIENNRSMEGLYHRSTVEPPES